MRPADDLVPYLGSYRMESGGREYRFALCPFCGYKKRAFYVNVNKETFHCFHCQHGGKLTALEEHLGISKKSIPYKPPALRWGKQAFERAHRRLLDSATAMQWLADRGIDEDTVKREMLGLIVRGQRRRDGGVWNADYLIIPYWETSPDEDDAHMFMVKYRSLEGKTYLREAGTESGFFRMYACAGSREIHLTEGELDALVLARYGLAAVSVPNGAQAGLSANDARLLETAERVYIWGDNDVAGVEFARRTAEVLGNRGYVIVLPSGVKDVTDLWKWCRDNGLDFKETVGELIQKAVAPHVDGFITLRQALDELARSLSQPTEEAAFYFPWADVTHSVATQPGDVIVLSAGTKVGKTTFAKQCALECVRRGLTLVYIATETQPAEFASIVVAETARVARHLIKPTDVEYAKNELGLSSDRLAIGVPVAHRVEDWKQAITRVIETYRPHVLILDYLQRMVGEDAKDQATFMTWMVNETIHNHIVTLMIVQPRKPVKVERTPDFLDIRGSSQIYEGAAHVFVLHRRIREMDTAGEAYERDGVLYRRLSRRPRGERDKFDLYFHPEYVCWVRAERGTMEERTWEY